MLSILKLLLITVMGTAEKELLFCDTFNHEGNEVWTLTESLETGLLCWIVSN